MRGRLQKRQIPPLPKSPAPGSNPVVIGGQEIVIKKFPKEFRRNFFRELDVRFYLILVASFVSHISLVLFLSSKVLVPLTSRSSVIQEQYANLLLDKEFPSGLPHETISPGLSSSMMAARLPSEQAETSIEAGKSSGLTVRSGPESIEARGPEMENLARAHAIEKEAQQNYRDRLSTKVSSLGLLKHIKNRVIGTEDYEFLQNTDKASGLLVDVLTQVDISKFSGNVTEGVFEANQKGKALTDSKPIRGKRVTVAKEADDVFGTDKPLEAAKIIPISKNEELTPVAKEEEKQTVAKGRRDPEVISAVVMSHNRAIQDCYKQALKEDPSLKGKITLRITVTPEGRVSNVTIVASNLNNPRLERCITTRIRRWNDFGLGDPDKGDVTFRQAYVFGY
ncbi:MAG: AgmX/PglI C-terminal domain-containing protein [candidate division KSB1 bacterium]|nr:AgmX/PglI C-terminal domain-containing protein [candidate division KSB1 bacterium]